MSDDEPADARREPVGAPVVRGDPEITGAHADDAAEFDPDDPESLEAAIATVRAFDDRPTGSDPIDMLQGAAACAALVRGVGSYTAAADRADVDPRFLRKWARVHDLPISVRREIARGNITPSAATAIAGLTGNARFLLAWAVVDHDLSVADVRAVTRRVTEGSTVAAALADRGVELGRIDLRLPPDTYRELHRQASLANRPPDALVADVLREWLASPE